MTWLLPVAAGIVVLAAAAWFGITVLREYERGVVFRAGRLRPVYGPGIRFLLPAVDRMERVDLRVVTLTIPPQEVITRDNAVILTNAIAFLKVTDPVKAVYGVTDFSEAIRNMIMTTLRSIVGEMELDEALSNRDKIKARLRESIADEAVDWGLTVKSVEIQDIRPSDSMQKAMEQQASAERERKAVVTRAEGAKQAAILEAEARLESSKRDANAQVMLAEASAEAIRRVTAAVGTETAPMLFLLGEKYIASLERMGSTDNAKVVVLPADLQEAVRGLIGGATRR